MFPGVASTKWVMTNHKRMVVDRSSLLSRPRLRDLIVIAILYNSRIHVNYELMWMLLCVHPWVLWQSYFFAIFGKVSSNVFNIDTINTRIKFLSLLLFLQKQIRSLRLLFKSPSPNVLISLSRNKIGWIRAHQGPIFTFKNEMLPYKFSSVKAYKVYRSTTPALDF